MSIAAQATSASSLSALYQQRRYGEKSSQIDWMPGDSSSAGDKVEISDEALSKYELAKLLDTFSVIYGDRARSSTKSLAEVAGDLEADFADFQETLGGFFQMAGIDTSTPLTLQPDGEGHIDVVGEHPDKAKIEELFSNNKQLISRFMIVAARSALVDAGETEPGFREDYAGDAVGAIKDHEAALKERLLGFQMTVTDGEFSTGFAE